MHQRTHLLLVIHTLLHQKQSKRCMSVYSTRWYDFFLYEDDIFARAIYLTRFKQKQKVSCGLRWTIWVPIIIYVFVLIWLISVYFTLLYLMVRFSVPWNELNKYKWKFSIIFWSISSIMNFYTITTSVSLLGAHKYSVNTFQCCWFSLLFSFLLFHPMEFLKMYENRSFFGLFICRT